MPHSRRYHNVNARSETRSPDSCLLSGRCLLDIRLGEVMMIGTENPRRNLVHRLSFAAAALFALTAVSGRPTHAMSPEAPGAIPAAQSTSDAIRVQMRGGGFHGGGGGIQGGGGGRDRGSAGGRVRAGGGGKEGAG